MATKLSVKAIVGMVVVAVLAGFAVADARDTDTSGRSRAALTVMAPAAAGGGWDLVARETQAALRRTASSAPSRSRTSPAPRGPSG